jgi:hypothetical protein
MFERHQRGRHCCKIGWRRQTGEDSAQAERGGIGTSTTLISRTVRADGRAHAVDGLTVPPLWLSFPFDERPRM